MASHAHRLLTSINMTILLSSTPLAYCIEGPGPDGGRLSREVELIARIRCSFGRAQEYRWTGSVYFHNDRVIKVVHHGWAHRSVRMRCAETGRVIITCKVLEVMRDRTCSARANRQRERIF